MGAQRPATKKNERIEKSHKITVFLRGLECQSVRSVSRSGKQAGYLCYQVSQDFRPQSGSFFPLWICMVHLRLGLANNDPDYLLFNARQSIITV